MSGQRLAAFAAVAGLVVGAPAASAAYRLLPYEQVDVQGRAGAVAIGDVDGDGHGDVVATVTRAGGARVLLVFRGNNGGTLGTPLEFPLAPALADSLRVAQLDPDAPLEIIAGHEGGLVVVDWDLPRGQPVVHTVLHGRTAGPRDATDLAVLDADGDGAMDVLAQGRDTAPVLYRGDGQGGFRATTDLTGLMPGASVVTEGDFDSDGNADFAAMTGIGTSDAHLRYGAGDGSFPDTQVLAPNPVDHGARALAVGDFDGDGRDDLVFARTRGQFARYRQDGDGTMVVLEAVSQGPTDPQALIAADVDRDGRDDLLALYYWGKLGVMPGADTKNAEVHDGPAFAAPFGSHALAAGDIDGDGCDDVAVAQWDAGLVLRRGFGCAPVADLEVETVMGQHRPILLRVRNRGDATADDAEALVEFRVKDDAAGAAKLRMRKTGDWPCTDLPSGPGTIRLTCALGDLPPDATVEVPFSLAILYAGPRALLLMDGSATSTTHEVDLADNADATRVWLTPLWWPTGRR